MAHKTLTTKEIDLSAPVMLRWPGEPPQPVKRGRGRPRKRPLDKKFYGMTLRVPAELRKRVRDAAQRKTDERLRVVSASELILEAVELYLSPKRKWWDRFLASGR